MKNKKIILFVILVCSFLFISVLIPTLAKLVSSKSYINNEWDGTVASSFNSGSGTKDAPYIISNASEFAYFKESLKNDDYTDKYVKITNDIILNAGFFKVGEDFQYIKDDVVYYLDEDTYKYYEDSSYENYVDDINEFEMLKSFNGNLNGGGHTIYGLFIKGDNSSLFESLTGTVNNLIIENAYIYGEYSSSGLSLNSNNAIINNVVVDGSILSSGKKYDYYLSNTLSDRVLDGDDTLNIDVDLPATSDYTFILSGTCVGEAPFTINGKTYSCENFEANINPFDIRVSSSSVITLTNLKYEYSYDVNISAGLVIKANNTSFENVVNRANVENIIASGILGISKDSNISASYNLGSINGDVSSGIVDTIISSSSSLNYVYNEGNLTNTSSGLVSNIIDSNIDINSSYNAYNTAALGSTLKSTISVNDSYNKIPNEDFLTYNKSAIKVLFNSEDFIYDDIPLTKLDYDNSKYVNIILDNNIWNTFKENLNYKSFDEDLSFILVSTKDYKAIKEVYYYLSLDELTKENLESVDWINYNSPIEVDKRGAYVLYVKVVNYNDEVSYLNTDRVYLYVDDIYASIIVDRYNWDDIHKATYSFLSNKKFEIKAYSKNDIKSIEYLVSERILDSNSLEESTSWITYTEPVDIIDDTIVYAKVEDNDSNIVYLNSDHFIDTKYNITALKSGSNLNYNSNMTYNSSLNFNVTLDNTDITLDGFERSIITNEVLPLNTHIVLSDLTNNKIYEYYVEENTKKEIPLNIFKEVGLTSNKSYLNDSNKDNFNVIIDFKNIEETNKEYSVYFKANRLIEELTSNVISFKLNSIVDDASSNLSITSKGNNTINYNSKSTTNITFNTSFNSTYLNTNYEDLDKSLIIEVIDKDGKLVNKNNYKSLKFIYKSNSYSPDNTNKTLIKLDDLSDLEDTLTVKTSEDISGLLTGNNSLRVSLGLTYNNVVKYRSNSYLDIPIVINKAKNNNYGFTINTNKRIVSPSDLFKFNINSSIDNPTIEVSLYKKKERNGTNQEYVKVNLSDYINESIGSISKGDTQVSFKENVEKNSYMFEFSLYDGNTFIGKNSIKVVVR